MTAGANTRRLKPKTLTQLRNQVRGALAVLRAPSTPDRPAELWQQRQIAQRQVSAALGTARKDLSPKEYGLFESWATEELIDQDRLLERIGSHPSTLGIVPSDLEPHSLEIELTRAVNSLREREAKIGNFLSQASLFKQAIESGDIESALNQINNIEATHGISYFSLEHRLDLIYARSGLEELKKEVRLQALHGSNLQKFFIYNFGVRNEPAQRAARFKANIKRRVESSRLKEPLQIYSRYRLCGELETTSKTLATLIAYEQHTTQIDLYYTVEKVSTCILANSGAFSAKELEVAKAACDTLQIQPFSFLHHVCSNGLQLALGLELKHQIQPSLHFISRGLAAFLSTQGDGLEAEDFEKAQINRSRLVDFYNLEDVARTDNLPAVGLASLQVSSKGSQPAKSINQALMQCLLEGLENKDSPLRSSKMVQALAQAKVLKDKERLEDAIQCLTDALVEEEQSTSADTLQICAAHLQIEVGDQAGALRTMATAGVANDRLLTLLPLHELFQNARWSSISHFAQMPELAICLDFYIRSSGNRKFRSYKRYAVEELMKAYAVKEPHQLVTAMQAKNIKQELLEYFFHYVCDIYTIELLPNIGKSRTVRQARIKLLKELAKISKDSALTYLQEADEVEAQIELSDVLGVLDDSKVYVDERAITSAINTELAADFQRYLRLVDSGMGKSDSIASVLQEFNNPTAKTFQVPDNEADTLFAEMMSHIREKFLFHDAAGLDVIIGRRIRHGTIAGELRGALEKSGLIGQRPRAGAAYSPPEAAAVIAVQLDPKQRKHFFSAFARFSESIDQQIALLRDDLFHVPSQSKPRGIFDLQLGLAPLALCRSVAQQCSSIEHFSRECVPLFWYFLSLRLSTVKKAIEADIRKALQATFGKLTRELKTFPIKDERLLEQVQQSSDELQRRAAVIAGWVRVPTVDTNQKTYSLRQIVDVAVAVVCGQRPGFKPSVNAVVPDEPELDAHGFSIVSDALYIAVDNISQRSGKKGENRVEINVEFNATTSLLSFKIENEVSVSARASEKISQVEKIKANINSKAFSESARRDKGSGLSKLAAIVMQAPKASIDFGFTSKPSFYLKFDLAYVSGGVVPVASHTYDSSLLRETSTL